MICRIRISDLTYPPDIGEIGLQTEVYDSPSIIMFQKPLPKMEQLREKEAVILTLPRNTPETLVRLKSHHFFNNVAAKREIGPDPNKEGIFLNRVGIFSGRYYVELILGKR